ncbi:MAG TPA: methylated-DNA--[protein]-cysteine S-methyltransferase [Bacteroidales bacterium]|nr:methylated-DNA--[protein]-cysteine S-methyltransferase [Bacteroidales bacterium]
MILSQKIDTPLGIMTACSVETGICLLGFGEAGLQRDIRFIEKHYGATVIEGANDHLDALKKQLSEYFEGVRKKFSVALSTPGTSFQAAVWKELENIEYGTTRTYLEQARALGKPDSVRAVAHANSLNRIAIVIPCHRVIGTNGTLTGYAGGLERKGWLLGHEKKHSGYVYDLSLF